MALPNSINDREQQKFVDTVDGPAVRVAGTNFTGSFSPSGLINGGIITEVTIDNVSWTPLPATPLDDRNALSIQNYTGQQIKLNYDNSVVGYVGVILDDQQERQYDIKDTIIIYAKSMTSTCTVIVEEIS